ncbi:12708_t:CDS:2 [Dentiscutata heterogama]|uniref:12708_t:CDS:1 n=1 Tax=Dentiscutata heterogama TaxID=1316150 RepID=A0ACA9M831_9GLOM|nr:12708_t:CDS:2 [Dentiscutata heterogama]
MLTSKLYDEVCNIASNIYMENENTGIEFSCLLELEATDDPHKLSKKIVELQDKENQQNIVTIENIAGLEDNENSENDLDDLYQDYELYLTKALKIIQEQRLKQNYRWAKSVKSSFAGLKKW